MNRQPDFGLESLAVDLAHHMDRAPAGSRPIRAGKRPQIETTWQNDTSSIPDWEL